MLIFVNIFCILHKNNIIVINYKLLFGKVNVFVIRNISFFNLIYSYSYIIIRSDDMFNFSDNFFKRVEKRTNVGKDTILNLAAKLQQNDLKNEATLREVIQELGKMTGKEVTKENENKIVEAVVNDKVPKDLDKFI